MEDEIKRLFLLILETQQHTLKQESAKIWLDRFISYGDISVKGLNKYLLGLTSSFLDMGEIMRLIRIEKAKGLGLMDGKTAWGTVIKKFGTYRALPDDLDPVTTKTINDIGGWGYLGKSANLMSDRSQFLKAHEQNYKEYIIEELYKYDN